MFSRRTEWQTTPNRLVAALAQATASGRSIINLTESNPTVCGFSYPAASILDAFQKPENLAYEPAPFGASKAREAVAAYYSRKGLRADPRSLTLTASTSEAYAFLFKLLANAGDSILVPAPSYPLFDLLAQLNDVTLVPYPLVYDGGWRIDFDRFPKGAGGSVRAVLVVNPNNPTGSYITEAERGRLNAVCREHGWAVICDEVFHDFPMDTKKEYPSLIGNEEVLTFTLGGASKSLGLPQMKAGWIHASGPREDVAAALHRLEIIQDTYLSVSTPAQNALPEWLSLQPDLCEQIGGRVRRNYAALHKAAGRRKTAGVLEVQGGWYAVLRLPEDIAEEEFCLGLLEEDGVFAHPGYFFDFEDGTHVVASLLLPEEPFGEGIRRLLERAGSAGH